MLNSQRIQGGIDASPTLCGVLLFSPLTVGHAAQITSQPGVSGIDLITVTGVINVGDDALFRRLAPVADKAIVVLNSEAGALSAGIEIGQAIRLRGFATAPETRYVPMPCDLTNSDSAPE
ncbi:hypothetical protein PY650_28585 [Rhizobium calliandrae]|uniref:Uncharacterized protein n=1 Tax=Rhizobium calliandrae TaxID=1312182 RepID=A0ABT7KND4_9HYPH|nr:hypothetical protein [Rhizobium calliandrae]MDL2409520.1 hypothetical protein [Rhizobium calliandrae]